MKFLDDVPICENSSCGRPLSGDLSSSSVFILAKCDGDLSFCSLECMVSGSKKLRAAREVRQ